VTKGFLPVLPRNSGFTGAADRATIGKRPGHSHSIISWHRNSLMQRKIQRCGTPNTVSDTDRKCRLEAIGTDR
jgi:hypothetical protein